MFDRVSMTTLLSNLLRCVCLPAVPEWDSWDVAADIQTLRDIPYYAYTSRGKYNASYSSISHLIYICTIYS